MQSEISIHAPHEGVRQVVKTVNVDNCISIHAPHEGVRRERTAGMRGKQYFNPRTPRGGATPLSSQRSVLFYFNPRTPRGGATIAGVLGYTVDVISIHAPHEGVRRLQTVQLGTPSPFQSTHPTRGCDTDCIVSRHEFCISIHAPHEGVRRPSGRLGMPLELISIHAPHEGVRRSSGRRKMDVFYFNPRTPRGGATGTPVVCIRDIPFQSTHPTRGCDHNAGTLGETSPFQSTHPTRGCDGHFADVLATASAFQSTHPTRGCDPLGEWFREDVPISIHAPHEGVRQ